MSKQVDERVVEMRFDNQQFENATKTTMSTLARLKQSLNLTGASKGLENVNSAAKNVNMSGLGSAVETVSAKFSALEVMGITALANITNSAVNAGKKIMSALTIDPIKTGFQEYETQINAVQTILANTQSKGTTLDDVNAALDTLNAYADKTIYNFTEMTRNIGTFTAAGVDLDTSVNAIQGIANLAAVSGSTSQQASTAMYQLSQALATGTVKLQDWNSVVNAGMGGEVFQNALIRTAAVMEGSAENVDAWRKKNIDSYGSFRDSLTEGAWLTTEVLTATLSQFTGNMTDAELKAQGFTDKQITEIQAMAKTANDAATKVKTFTQLFDTLKEGAQSGWTQSWEIIIGNFEEAKEVLTKISDVVGGIITDSANARNELLTGGLRSGWDQLLGKGISNESDYIDTVKKVAKEHNISIDEMIGKSGSFEETLEQGWLTSDILSESISKYADNLRGMSDAELEAAGYTKEHVTEIEALETAVKNGTVSLDELAERMTKPSGRENLIDSLWNVFKGIMSIIKPIKEAFRDIFPATTADQLYNFTESLKEFTSKLILSEETSNNLKRTFKGLFAILDIGKQLFLAVFNAIKPLFGEVDNLGGGILGITASFGDWLVNIDKLIKSTNIFGKDAQKISGFIKNIINISKEASNVVASFISKVREKLSFPGIELLHGVLNRAQERLTSFMNSFSEMKSGTTSIINGIGSALANSKFLQSFKLLWDGVKQIASGITSVLGDFINDAIDKISNVNFNGVIDMFNGLIAGGIGVGLMNFLKSVTDTFSSLQDITDGVVDILDGVRGCFEAYQTQLKAGTLLKIASAIGILAASILVISLIDSEKLSSSLGAITVLFVNLMSSMAIFGKISGNNTGLIKSASAMIGLSVAVLILASALKKIASLQIEEIFKGLLGVIGLTATMVAAMIYLSDHGDKAVKGAFQMVIFAAAIKILASVCKDLSSLKWDELGKGLIGVGILLAEVSLFLNTAQFNGKSITTAMGIVILAAAMKILASACKDFGSIQTNEIVKGLSSIGIILAEVALFTNASGYAKHVVSSAASLVIIGAAMKIFASATKDFGSIPMNEIIKGLSGIGIALGIVALAMNVIPKNSIAIGAGLVIVGGALEIIADVMSKIGSMSTENIVKAVAGIGIALAELSLALNAMNGTLAGSAALLVASVALSIFTPVLSVLGAMPIENIVKALIALAGSFAILGIAGAVLTPLVPTILALGGAFVLIGAGVSLVGVGLLAAGAGLSALAVGFTALATAGAGGATAIVAALTVIITGIVSIIPAIIEKIGEAIIAICKIIIEAAPAIGEAIVAVILSIIDVLTECIPELVDGLFEILSKSLESLAQYTPQIVDSLFQFLINLLKEIGNNLPELIQVAVDTIMAFFQGVVDALKGIDTSSLLEGIVGVGLLAGIMVALSAVVVLIPGAMAGVLGMGLVIAELALVLAAIGGLAQIPGLEWLIEEGGQFLQKIGTAIGQFAGGIVGGFMGGVSSSLPQIGTDLTDFMNNLSGFIIGAKNIDESALSGISSLVKMVALITGANILESIASWATGTSSMDAFTTQLNAFGDAITSFSAKIKEKGIDETAIIAAANAGKIMSEMQSTLVGTGGVIQWFSGEKDMATFGTQLVSFGDAIVSFSNKVSEGTINETAIIAAANAGKIMSEMQTTITPTGGVIQFFTGEHNLQTFGTQIVEFGQAIVDFSEKVSGNIDESAITAAANAGRVMAELQNAIPEDNWFDGKVTIDDFGKDIKKFGESISDYSEEVSDINTGAVSNSVSAARRLVDLANSFTNIDPNGINNFKVKSIGKAIKDYSDKVSDINAGAITTSISTIRKLISLINSMSSINTSGVSTFKSAISSLSGLEKSFSGSVTKLSSVGSNMMDSLTKGIKIKQSSVISVTTNIIDAMIKVITGKYTNFNTAGINIINKFVSGISSQKSKVKSTMTSAVSEAVSGVRSYYNSFYGAGTHLGSGLVIGINSKQAAVKQAGYNLGKKAVEGEKEGQKSNSPSKLTIQAGEWFGEGLIIGINSMGKKVYDAGYSAGDTAVKSMSLAMTKINDLVNSDIDAQPTISPVIDLSNIESGASAISGMFSNNIIGVSARVNAISSSINGNIQNGGNGEIVSAINKLRKDLGNVGNTYYSIDGITYDDGSNVSNAIQSIVRAAIVERRR